MKYGFYEKSEDDDSKEVKLSTYSESKERGKHKISQTEQKLSSQQNNTKGISFGSIKSAGGEAAKEASKEGMKNAASAAASKAPSVAVQVIDKAKKGLQKALEYAKSAERPPDEESTEGTMKGILCASCVVFCVIIIFPFLFLPMVVSSSVIPFFIGGIKETETKQVPHTWEPYERNLECADCTGTGLNICIDCSGRMSVSCSACDGKGYTKILYCVSGTVPQNVTSGIAGLTYKSYALLSGCRTCGGSGYGREYYNQVQGAGGTIGYQDISFVKGTGTVPCSICNATGRTGRCLSCNGQGVYYHCTNEDCPYHEWNHWESLGVDMDGICYEKEGEVSEDD